MNFKYLIKRYNLFELIKLTIIELHTKKYKKHFNDNPLWIENSNVSKANVNLVIYTVIFGNYDDIQEPEFYGESIEYYIITDQELSEDSRWKKYDYFKWESRLQGMSNIQKNRFFKMNAHLVFADYKYSVYVDGNVRIKDNPWKLVNRIGTSGVAVYRHKKRFCVYDEALFYEINRNIKDVKIHAFIKKLKKEKMPKGYGLLQCSIIYRDHENSICRKVMEQWWNCFCNSCDRDQLSLPYILYKNSLSTMEFDGLGNDFSKSEIYYTISHK